MRANQQKERDWCWCWPLVDQWIIAGGGDWSLWVNENGSGYLWIGVGGKDRYLWVDRDQCLWVLILVVLVVES